MKRTLVSVLGICFLFASGVFAEPVDLTNPEPAPLTPPECAADVPKAAQMVEADADCNGTALTYVAMVLDYDATDNLFIKVQEQGGGGKFNYIGFYHGNNGSGWPGMTGGGEFVQLPDAEQFTRGHIKVEHDGRGNVTLTTPRGVYTRGGWTPRNGLDYGYGTFDSTARMDNFTQEGTLCDDFNRPDGGLGPDWNEVAQTGRIVNQAAQGVPGAFPALLIYEGTCGGWGKAYAMTFSGLDDVLLLRKYRDNILLLDALGSECVSALYKNSEAALQLVLTDAKLRKMAAGLVDNHREAITKATSGEIGVIDDAPAVLAFLDRIAESRVEDLALLAEISKAMVRGSVRTGLPVMGLKFE